MDVHTVVIGGGLAGLGCAMQLAKQGKLVVVLEKTADPFAGERKVEPRYDVDLPASYKSAGMMELYVPGETIMNYFMKETRRVYDEAGVAVRSHCGMSMATTKLALSAIADLYDDRETFLGEKLKEYELKEPNLNYQHVEGVYYEPQASAANPEDTMETLFAHSRKLGVNIMFQQELLSIKKSDGVWKVKTKAVDINAENIIVAAGPWSRAIMKTYFSTVLPMKTVLGVITEVIPPETAPVPYFNGLVMGSKSAVTWAIDDVEAAVLHRPNIGLEVTRYQKAKEKKATHLYISVQKGNLFVGGPRIALRDNYARSDLNPDLYKSDMQDTLNYASKLVKFPENAKEKGRWCGLMAFPSRDELPYIGAVDATKFPGLYLCTGFASGGFRGAVGAGTWLSKCILENGGKPIADGTEVDMAHCMKVNPRGRLGPKGSSCDLM